MPREERAVACYSSMDLGNWTFRRDVFKMSVAERPADLPGTGLVLERPKDDVIEDSRTRKATVTRPQPRAPRVATPSQSTASARRGRSAYARRVTGTIAPMPSRSSEVQSTFSREGFCQAVRTCKDYVEAGDIIQVVLSQRIEVKTLAQPFDVYRALRIINPSPYMYFLRLGDLSVAGSSPEVLVRLEEGHIDLRPIAGTRPRGRDETEDRTMAAELLGDPKERAEHIMLVDLGRNDVGRVAVPGSVEVNELMVIERYSHVMHIVSNVRGRLAEGLDAFDLIRASFPAGTVTGAPKIRAMEIIEEQEPVKRGPYAGAIGYVSFSGNMDTCITIRTILFAREGAWIQV